MDSEDGTLLLSFDNGPAKYGGTIAGNVGYGASSTFDGTANGCWYLTKQGTVGIHEMAPEETAGHQSHDAAGNPS